ncbi:glycine receptor subunit alpha-2-like, partial [Argopecten irradians]|uniref:glycine receptor subunit alpha-2-like n=1 Tax=Argopecten irradians TaxID=31199 RepID=UPI00371D7CCB
TVFLLLLVYLRGRHIKNSGRTKIPIKTLFYSCSRSDFIAALIIDYDNRIPPNFENNNYTVVDVSLFINSIDSISESSMDFTLNAFIQQEWFDFRLQFFDLIDSSYLELDAKLIEDVWVPDLYFTNEKSAALHDVTVPNKMMHLYSDGRIVYRQRVSVTASCPMQLHKYPFDSQVCSLYIQSCKHVLESFTASVCSVQVNLLINYIFMKMKKERTIYPKFLMLCLIVAYSLGRLRFVWRKNNPVRTNRNVQLPQFTLTRHSARDCTEVPSTEERQNFTCIQMDLYLTRNIGFFMIQIYVPTVLIVSLSWVSFWLSIDAVPARISLGILTVLTITTQKTGSVAAIPPVSYVKALDIWMAICLLFVFMAFLEYPFVYVLENREICMMQIKSSQLREECTTSGSKSASDRSPNSVTITTGRLVDDISKVVFPVIFLTFIIVYWIFYSI